MEVCDINHVMSLSGYMADSPLIEFDDHKGIIEGFAGLVLISDDVWLEENHASAVSDGDWTSDEDDEQIQSLKRKQTQQKQQKQQKQRVTKMAPITMPEEMPPPQLANTFAEYTKKQRA
eukprot:488834_1